MGACKAVAKKSAHPSTLEAVVLEKMALLVCVKKAKETLNAAA